MSTSFQLVDTKGWEYDLHSVYSGYIGYFQINNIPWYEKSWGHLFSSFEEFLAFSWPVITVTDSWTGRAHIVTRLNSIGAFIKMIKTRFGEVLPQAPNILRVSPFENTQRHLRHVSDYPSYKKLHSTLPAAVLSALKTRVRAGEPTAVKELWERRDKTFLALDFEWNERNKKSVLEWGYAAVRCGVLDANSHWPPIPDLNYRKGHYIVSEYVDKVFNKHCPTFPWQYAFGDSQVLPKAKLPEVMQAIISSLASPDSETTPNTLVLVAHGVSGDLQRLEEMGIRLPHNVLIIDTAAYERNLFTTGFRTPMVHPKTNKPRSSGTTLSLENLLRSFTLPPEPVDPTVPSPKHKPIILPNCKMHNSGNDAFMCLFALQMLLEPETQVPTVKKGFIGRPATGSGPPTPGGLGIHTISTPTGMVPTPLISPIPIQMMSMSISGGGTLPPPPPLVYDLSDEFGKMQMQHQPRPLSRSPGSRPNLASSLTPGYGNGTRDTWHRSPSRDRKSWIGTEWGKIE